MARCPEDHDTLARKALTKGWSRLINMLPAYLQNEPWKLTVSFQVWSSARPATMAALGATTLKQPRSLLPHIENRQRLLLVLARALFRILGSVPKLMPGARSQPPEKDWDINCFVPSTSLENKNCNCQLRGTVVKRKTGKRPRWLLPRQFFRHDDKARDGDRVHRGTYISAM